MRKLFGVIIPAATIAVLLGAAALAPADAWDKSRNASLNIGPHNAETIQLGYVRGVAYYTPEADGFHVVATLSVADGAPLRFTATLQPEQSVTFSVPGMEGDAPKNVEIARRGDNLSITRPLRVVLN